MADDKNGPYVENYPVLEEWLDRQKAKHAWSLAVATMSGMRTQRMVNSYIINGRTFIVTVEANQRGWNIYTALDSLEIVDTLVDAEQRLGINTKVKGEK